MTPKSWQGWALNATENHVLPQDKIRRLWRVLSGGRASAGGGGTPERVAQREISGGQVTEEF